MKYYYHITYSYIYKKINGTLYDLNGKEYGRYYFTDEISNPIYNIILHDILSSNYLKSQFISAKYSELYSLRIYFLSNIVLSASPEYLTIKILDAIGYSTLDYESYTIEKLEETIRTTILGFNTISYQS